MKQILLILTAISFLGTSASGQVISKQEADSLTSALSKTKSVADSIEVLSNLAQYHIFKEGENKTDLDRAAIYINQAKALSKTINSPEAKGYLLLTESYLTRERGDRAAGQKMVEDAIKVLQPGTNKSYLGWAYTELGRYYSYNNSWQLPKAKQYKLTQAVNVGHEIGLRSDTIKSQGKAIMSLQQQNTLQQENLRQASMIRNIIIVGIILALIIIGLLYRQYRQKQKSNRQVMQKNEQLQQLLAEKEWLVKEIHHRVKNNLQMVVSLLNTQTEFLTHPSAIDAIKESRERMQAIAIIHQKLYQLDNSAQVNMRSYINELIDNINHSFADSERIHFKVDVADVSLDISQSVPIGLMLNEAITNAIKYAYPKNEKGSIEVSLKHYDIDKLQVKVADNGKGLPAEVDIKHSNSLGLQLIKLFSEQLDGDLYFLNNNGLEIILNFKSIEVRNFESRKISA